MYERTAAPAPDPSVEEIESLTGATMTEEQAAMLMASSGRCRGIETRHTADQFNKKRVLLPQTLDISYSGVHGNKKFPTVEGPEVVRQGKRADVAWAGVEASRKFYFGILNFPVPESIEPAHMWIVDPRAGAGLRNFIFRF